MSKKETVTFQEYLEVLNGCTNGYVYKDDNMRKVSKNKFKEIVYRNVYNRLCNILLKLYKWKVPDTFNARSIELGLLLYGYQCAYNGPEGTYCLSCNPSNMYNIYGEPTQVRAFGYNGYQTVVDIDLGYESPTPNQFKASLENTKNVGVFMRDNDMAYPYINYVKEYAYKLTDKILALNVAVQRIKMPLLFTVKDRELKDTVEKLVEKIEDNDTTIITLNNNLNQGLDNFRLENPTTNASNVDAIKNAIVFDFNMFLETCGINTNPSPDKSQVVLTPELDSNNSLIDIEKDVRFMNRQQFCKDCKRIGIDISIELNEKEASQEIDKFKKEVISNGNDSE